MRENWLPVIGFEGLYEVSDSGNVRSLHKKHKTPHVLSPAFTPRTGYWFVSLSGKEKAISRNVHRLVAAAFLGDPNGREVNHVNGMKSDNRLVNIEYVTRSQNLRHRIDVLGIKCTEDRNGENGHNTTLTNVKVLAIRKLYAEGKSLLELAERFGVTRSGIAHVVKRRNWTHI